MSEFSLILRRNLTDIGALIGHGDIADNEGIALVRNASILDDENRAGRQDVAFFAFPQQSVSRSEFVDFARQADRVAHTDAEMLRRRREIRFFERRAHLFLFVVIVRPVVGRFEIVVKLIGVRQRIGRSAQHNYRRHKNYKTNQTNKKRSG